MKGRHVLSGHPGRRVRGTERSELEAPRDRVPAIAGGTVIIPPAGRDASGILAAPVAFGGKPLILPAPAPEPEEPGEPAAPEAVTAAREPLPRRVPGATLPAAPAPGSPGDILARALTAPERPGPDVVRLFLDALKGLDVSDEAVAARRDAARQPAPAPAEAVALPAARPALREPSPVPGAAVLLGLGGPLGNAAAALDGMPERRTLQGRPVIHLGDDPRHPGEAFAIADVSDAWLDALIAAALDERGTRRAARDGGTGPQAAPSFTPREQEEG